MTKNVKYIDFLLKKEEREEGFSQDLQKRRSF